MTSTVEIWWLTISVIAALNIGMFAFSAILLARHKTTLSPENYQTRRILLWLAGAYTLGCAFRSFLPRIDLERIALVDSWLSSMLIGRTVATIAEICFIVQCAILLREAGRAVNDRFSLQISQVLIPMIVIAEICSWYAVLSTHYLGSVIEESLWTIAGLLLVISFVSLWRYVTGYLRHFIAAMTIFAIGYVLFMVTIDVPLYWSRWQMDTAAGIDYLHLKQGFIDITRNYSVSFDWEVWRQEIPWMTLYFTVAVWVSIYLPHAPSFTRTPDVRANKPSKFFSVAKQA